MTYLTTKAIKEKVCFVPGSCGSDSRLRTCDTNCSPPLDEEYLEKTLEHLYYLWDRPVHLETVVNEDKVLFTYDGSRHAPYSEVQV